MLQASTLKFLTGLKKNNNKPWFDKNRAIYDAAKSDFYGLTEDLIHTIAGFDPSIAHLAVKDCVFRINRDVRFSKDKSPYKTNMGCYFNKAGKKSNYAGYYLHIEPGNSFAGGGLWMPEPAVLGKIRQEIDYNFADWKTVTGNAAFKKTFTKGVSSEDSLKRPPKGYDENNPAIEFLKLKSFVVSTPVADAQIKDKNFVKEVSKIFKTMKPMIDFLNTSIE